MLLTAMHLCGRQRTEAFSDCPAALPKIAHQERKRGRRRMGRLVWAALRAVVCHLVHLHYSPALSCAVFDLKQKVWVLMHKSKKS